MQLTKEQHIEGHERQLAGLKQSKQEFQDLEKLMNNTLFRKVILERFCVQECARYVRMSVEMGLSPEARADSLAKAQAAAHLLAWITVELRQGQNTVEQISGIEQSLEILRQTPDDDEQFEQAVELH